MVLRSELLVLRVHPEGAPTECQSLAVIPGGRFLSWGLFGHSVLWVSMLSPLEPSGSDTIPPLILNVLIIGEKN